MINHTQDGRTEHRHTTTWYRTSEVAACGYDVLFRLLDSTVADGLDIQIRVWSGQNDDAAHVIVTNIYLATFPSSSKCEKPPAQRKGKANMIVLERKQTFDYIGKA